MSHRTGDSRKRADEAKADDTAAGRAGEDEWKALAEAERQTRINAVTAFADEFDQHTKLRVAIAALADACHSESWQCTKCAALRALLADPEPLTVDAPEHACHSADPHWPHQFRRDHSDDLLQCPGKPAPLVDAKSSGGQLDTHTDPYAGTRTAPLVVDAEVVSPETGEVEVWVFKNDYIDSCGAVVGYDPRIIQSSPTQLRPKQPPSVRAALVRVCVPLSALTYLEEEK